MSTNNYDGLNFVNNHEASTYIVEKVILMGLELFIYQAGRAYFME